jgi:hypothetical protein
VLLTAILALKLSSAEYCVFITWEYEGKVERYCLIAHYDLTLKNKDEDLVFGHSPSSLSDVGGFKMVDVGNVEFLPKYSDLKESFPNLENIVIEGGNLPVIKNDLFDKSYEAIKHIQIIYARVHTIEKNALQYLSNLRVFLLNDNQIANWPLNVFWNNKKLEIIDLRNNYINAISPILLKDLPNLKKVSLSGNRCVRENFDGSSITEALFHDDLERCYNNCKELDECQVTVEVTTEMDSFLLNKFIGSAENITEEIGELKTVDYFVVYKFLAIFVLFLLAFAFCFC